MPDDFINDPRFRKWFPPVSAVIFVVLFVSLGSWQIDRAGQKNRTRALFASDAAFATLAEAANLGEYERFSAEGRYDAERQVLLENAFVDGRSGYFVLTPFQPAGEERWLLVNRGWVPRPADGEPLPDISLAEDARGIRGRVGQLPKIGMRSGPAFTRGEGWPRKARYPTGGELAAELGESLLPFVMLLDPGDADGFVRRWEPQESGPMMHYGYALQWFAMAAGVVALMVWHVRKVRARAGG